jgi:hypothetical protein
LAPSISISVKITSFHLRRSFESELPSMRVDTDPAMASKDRRLLPPSPSPPPPSPPQQSSAAGAGGAAGDDEGLLLLQSCRSVPSIAEVSGTWKAQSNIGFRASMPG